METDLIIIGSGPGGYRSAEYAAKKGLQVTIFEGATIGGTCLNCGCIPTKTFCHAASLEKKEFITASEHKNAVVEQLRQGVEQLMTMPGITLVKGWATFVDNNTVECSGETYQAKNIIIATGSKAKIPPIEGVNLPHVLTSTELLDIDHVPTNLVIIGAGVIGMEFASIFNSFGSKVTVIEFLKECLPSIDSEIAKRLRKSLEKKGVDFMMQSAVKLITPDSVVFERKGKETSIVADTVLIATGRSANIDQLHLENTDVKTERKGISVNENMQSSVPHIYAIGDANGNILLAHAATMQGIRAVNHMIGQKDQIRLDIMPAAVFTTPEVASVGKTEDECKEQGMDYICKKGLYRANGKALSMNETEGLLKLLADRNGHIIGCHAMGAHAADMIQETAALMNFNATIEQLKDIVHIHPTLGEILQATAEQF